MAVKEWVVAEKHGSCLINMCGGMDILDHRDKVWIARSECT